MYNTYKVLTQCGAFTKSSERTSFIPSSSQPEKEKVTAEDERVGWHRRLNGQESDQTLDDSEGQGSLACGSPRGCKELDTT